MTAPRPTILRIAPVLLVREVGRAAAWYRDALGFEIDFLHGDPPFYGSVSRDGHALHLRHVDEPGFAEAARKESELIAAFIEVSDIPALSIEFASRGAEIAQALTRQTWGGTDLHVRDPDGNVVAFVGYDGASA